MKYFIVFLGFLSVSCASSCSFPFSTSAKFKTGEMTRVIGDIHIGQEFLISDRYYDNNCLNGIRYTGTLQNESKEGVAICEENLVRVYH